MSQIPRTSWWRRTTALTVGWELRRRQKRLERRQEIIAAILPYASRGSTEAMLEMLLQGLSVMAILGPPISRRRPWIARGTRPDID
jgi:hypothetical protein